MESFGAYTSPTKDSFDLQGLEDDEENSGLATLRELSSEVARQTPEAELANTLPLSVSATSEPERVNQPPVASMLPVASPMAVLNPQKNTQFILVGGQKFPVGQGMTPQSTNKLNQPVCPLPMQSPLPSVMPTQTFEKDKSPVNAAPTFAQQLQAQSQKQPLQQTQILQPLPTQQQQPPPPVVLKVPTNKLALKGQIVKTADQKLMLVTEVGGKKVGYLIRQQALQLGGQSGPITIGNVSDNRMTQVAGIPSCGTSTLSTQPILSATGSSGVNANSPSGNLISALPTSVTQATTLLTKAAASVSKPGIVTGARAVSSPLPQPTVIGGTPSVPQVLMPSGEGKDLNSSQTDNNLLDDQFSFDERKKVLPSKEPGNVPDDGPSLNTTNDSTPLNDEVVKTDIKSEINNLENNNKELRPVSELPQASDSPINLECSSPPAEELMEPVLIKEKRKSESSDEDSTPLSAVAASLKAEQEESEPLSNLAASLKSKGGRGTPRKDKGKKRGPRGKKKADKIPKPAPAYQLFFKDIQASIRQENPTLKFGEVSKVVSQSWETLSAEQKQVYKEQYDKAREEYAEKVAAQKRQEEQEDSAPLASLIAKEPAMADAAAETPMDTDPDVSSTSSAHDESIDESQGKGTVEDAEDIEMKEVDAYGAESVHNKVVGNEMEVDRMISDSDVGDGPGNVPEANSIADEAVANEVPSQMMELSSRRQKKGSKIREPKEPRKKRKKKIREPIITEETGNIEEPMEDTADLPKEPVKITVKISEEGKVVKVDQSSSPTKAAPQSPVSGLSKFKIPIRTQRQDSTEGNEDVKGGNGETNTDESKTRTPGPRLCVRDGCANPAKTSRERGSQYCSNDCLVLHCRNVFAVWVEELRAESVES